MPFAWVANALQSLGESRSKAEQHEILKQLFTRGAKDELEAYLLLKMLMPRYDNECVYGMKTRRLMLVFGDALRKMGKSDAKAALQQWMKNVPLQSSLLAKGRGIVCLPELAIGAQCVRASMSSSSSSEAVTLIQMGVVCRLLTTAYLSAGNNQQLLETAQSEIIKEVIEKGRLSFQEWLAFVRMLLKKVSMGVGPETVLGALPHANSRDFFSKRRDLAQLARLTVSVGGIPARVDCGVPFCPMTCHHMRSPYLMQWLFSASATMKEGQVGAKENHLVICKGKWYVTVSKANAKERLFVDLNSDEATTRMPSRRRLVLLLREFQRAGMLAKSVAGQVIHFRVMSNKSARDGEVVQLLILGLSPRTATDQNAYKWEEDDEAAIIHDLIDLIVIPEAQSGRKKLHASVATEQRPPPAKVKKTNKKAGVITADNVRARNRAREEEEEDDMTMLVVQQKYDGDRIQIHIHKPGEGGVQLFTKWGKDVSELYSDVRDELVTIMGEKHAPCILDGELVVVDKTTEEPMAWSSTKWRYNDGKTGDKTVPLNQITEGVVAFVYEGTVNNLADEDTDEQTTTFMNAKDIGKWSKQGNNNNTGGRIIKNGMLRVIVYDIIMYDGKEVHDQGCQARLRLLRKEIGPLLERQAKHCRVIKDTHALNTMDELFVLLRQVIEKKQEGLVLKDPTAKYEFGKSSFVQKLKLSGPEINTGVIGVGSSLSANPRMCGILTCIGWKPATRLISYCRVEVLEGEKPWKAIEHIMTEVDSKVSVGELEEAMKMDKVVMLPKYAVKMVSVGGARHVSWRPVREEDMRYECDVIIMTGDLVDIQWLVSPYECCFGLSVHGDLRQLEYERDSEWIWKPRNPVGRIELREYQMSSIDTAAGVKTKYETAQVTQTCIETHMTRRIHELRALPAKRERLVEIARVLQCFTVLPTAVWPQPEIMPTFTIEGVNLLLSNALKTLGPEHADTFKELKPEERLALHGCNATSGVWKTWKEKHNTKRREEVQRMENAEDATAKALKVAEQSKWSARFKEFCSKIDELRPVTHSVGKTSAAIDNNNNQDDNTTTEIILPTPWDQMQEECWKNYDEDSDEEDSDEEDSNEEEEDSDNYATPSIDSEDEYRSAYYGDTSP